MASPARYLSIHTIISTVENCGTAQSHTVDDVVRWVVVQRVSFENSSSHGIVVADANDCVSVFGSHLLTSALDAAGVGPRWVIASAVPPHRLRAADVASLPTHVRKIVPRVVVADPDLLSTADLVIGFTELRWPVVDHVRALHCPAPALALPEFIDDGESLAGSTVSFAALSDAALRHALARSTASNQRIGAETRSERFWTDLADVCARFATLLRRIDE